MTKDPYICLKEYDKERCPFTIKVYPKTTPKNIVLDWVGRVYKGKKLVFQDSFRTKEDADLVTVM